MGAAMFAAVFLFARGMGNVKLAANASMKTCNGELSLCLKSAETVSQCQICTGESDIKTVSCQACAAKKAECQNLYNTCSGEGGKLHPW